MHSRIFSLDLQRESQGNMNDTVAEENRYNFKIAIRMRLTLEQGSHRELPLLSNVK